MDCSKVYLNYDILWGKISTSVVYNCRSCCVYIVIDLLKLWGETIVHGSPHEISVNISGLVFS